MTDMADADAMAGGMASAHYGVMQVLTAQKERLMDEALIDYNYFRLTFYASSEFCIFVFN